MEQADIDENPRVYNSLASQLVAGLVVLTIRLSRQLGGLDARDANGVST